MSLFSDTLISETMSLPLVRHKRGVWTRPLPVTSASSQPERGRVLPPVVSTRFLSPSQEKIDLSLDNITLPQSLTELNVTATQMGLDPLLDSLNLEDGQLVIGDEGLEGTLLGMATPMSEIPVPFVHPFTAQSTGDITLHHLDDAEHELRRFLSVTLLNASRLEELQLQEGPRMEEEPQDVDFGPDPMDFDVPEPVSPRITLTPPKNPTRKRAFLPVPTDQRIELSDELWKRQCTELAVQVAKRPPLPLDDSERPDLIAIRYSPALQEYLQLHVSYDRALLLRQSTVCF